MISKIVCISQCLNEIFYIKASIENFLLFVDEILIQDNGSLDGTKEYLQELTRVEPRVRVLFAEQPTKIHYHPSWNEPKQWNHLIDLANSDWVFISSVDECHADTTDLRSMISSKPKAVAFRFARLAVYPDNQYASGWFPDWQTKLFNRNACGGIRFQQDKELHGVPVGDLGTGNPPAPMLDAPDSAIAFHYHHGFGPKKGGVGPNNIIKPLPPQFTQPQAAVKHILSAGTTSSFEYDMSLYGRIPGTYKGR